MPDYFIHICKGCKGQANWSQRDRTSFGWYCPNWREPEGHATNFYGYLSPDGVERVQVYSAEQFQERRKLDQLHQDARDLALREAHSSLGYALFKINNCNYGLAREDIEELREALDDEHGTCQLVTDKVNQLAEWRGI